MPFSGGIGRRRVSAEHAPECPRLDGGEIPTIERQDAPFRRDQGIRTVEGMESTSLIDLTTLSPIFPPPQLRAAARAVNAVKVYGSGSTTVRALDGVDVAIPEGRFTAVMGPSGSGKSTLLHCLAGLDTLTSGQVFIGDVDLGRLSDRQLTKVRREQLGFVFQSFNLVPTLNAKENILLPLDLAGTKPDSAWVQTVIETVGLTQRLKHRPSELSGGQQQRVAVARALASKPKVIFADEPTGNLDSRTGGEILDFMTRAVREFGQTIVMVTHDAAAAARADEVIFLADGQIVDHVVDPTAARLLDRIKQLGN